ncbi:MAG: 2-dehydropantoate 2-reductase [Pseudomonadota bacterium]
MPTPACPPLRIVVFGAGSIGCYVGGRLAAAGGEVHFVGRQTMGDVLCRHGLSLTDLHGTQQQVAADDIRFSTDLRTLADADLVLVCVKSGGTAAAAAEIAGHLCESAVVLSLQNGLHNADELRARLPQHAVLTGMVPFNVVNRGEGRFHRGSAGEPAVERHALLAPFRALFARAGLPLDEHDDMPAVLWAKLLLNLNNAVNALSGLPLKTELSQRDFRRCLALAQREALDLLAVARQPLARLTPLPPHWIPALLTVPDPLFRLLANRMLAIDPLARSSMWEDLQAGRRTEIDWINGEVLQLARSLGRSAPVNARLIALIRAAEQGGRRDFGGAELLNELRSAVAGN